MRRALLVLALAGCGGTGPIAPEPFDPPAVYEAWAAEVLACAGREPDPDFVASIRWMVAEGFAGEPHGWRVWGQWDAGTIYLRPEAVEWEHAVKHEMIHHLLAGDPGHTDARWRCEA